MKAIQEFGNPSSLHRWGRGGKEVLEDARYRVADVMGVAPDQVVFTSGASEANNMVLQSFVPDAVVVSAIEHPSVSGVWDAASVAQVERDGVVSLKSVKDAVTDATECVAVMAANNETGVIQPIHEIGEWCSGKGIKFHVDAVQAFGRVDWSWNDLPYDFLSLSAHKLCGPKGVGVLIAKDVDVLHAMIRGGGQEMGFRAGTEPTHMALSMAVAMELAAEEGVSKR